MPGTVVKGDGMQKWTVYIPQSLSPPQVHILTGGTREQEVNTTIANGDKYFHTARNWWRPNGDQVWDTGFVKQEGAKRWEVGVEQAQKAWRASGKTPC